MFASRRPEKSRRGRFWNWLNPKLGQTLNGWLCGKVIGVETHYLAHTQPCRRFLTGGRMRCYCSTMKLESVWKGYVPLLDADGVQSFAIIGERYADLAEAIPMFAPVSISRLRSNGSPVCVKQSDWTVALPPLKTKDFRPKDIRPWLLKLWGDKELTAWLEDHPEVRDAEEAPDLDPAAFTPINRAAAERANVVNRLPPLVGDVVKKLPSLNGKADHK